MQALQRNVMQHNAACAAPRPWGDSIEGPQHAAADAAAARCASHVHGGRYAAVPWAPRAPPAHLLLHKPHVIWLYEEVGVVQDGDYELGTAGLGAGQRVLDARGAPGRAAAAPACAPLRAAGRAAAAAADARGLGPCRARGGPRRSRRRRLVVFVDEQLLGGDVTAGVMEACAGSRAAQRVQRPRAQSAGSMQRAAVPAAGPTS